MQNRYVGDIGDYLKLGILCALLHGHRLGVAWWLYPGGSDDSRIVGRTSVKFLRWCFRSVWLAVL